MVYIWQARWRMGWWRVGRERGKNVAKHALSRSADDVPYAAGSLSDGNVKRIPARDRDDGASIASIAELLHVLLVPDFERAAAIGEL
jgi:hypothetical protein